VQQHPERPRTGRGEHVALAGADEAAVRCGGTVRGRQCVEIRTVRIHVARRSREDPVDRLAQVARLRANARIEAAINLTNQMAGVRSG